MKNNFKFHTVSSEKLLVYKNNNENEVNRNINDGGEVYSSSHHQSAQSPLSHKCSLVCRNGKDEDSHPTDDVQGLPH